MRLASSSCAAKGLFFVLLFVLIYPAYALGPNPLPIQPHAPYRPTVGAGHSVQATAPVAITLDSPNIQGFFVCAATNRGSEGIEIQFRIIDEAGEVILSENASIPSGKTGVVKEQLQPSGILVRICVFEYDGPADFVAASATASNIFIPADFVKPSD